MSKPELTEWFSSEVKPVHIGVYETDTLSGSIGLGFAYWDGEKRGNSRTSPDNAKNNQGNWQNAYQNKKWRGLSQEPINTEE